MASGYFHRVARETPTRFWINNPSSTDVRRAIEAGAINCTTNPAFCSKLVQSDPAAIGSIIARVVEETQDDDEAAASAYRMASARVMGHFLPLYEQSGGKYGYVTMQDDPRQDEDADAVIRAALRNRELGPNYMAKIPVIPAGIEAIDVCVEENLPICATEIFSIAQAVHICEAYERASRRTGNRPPFYVTHISGIFDEYLAKVARREGISVDKGILDQAGCAVARKEYQMIKERGYPGTVLGGGARGTHHFTEMVGGDVHVTINWDTAEELLRADPPVISRIDAEPSPSVADELSEKFVDFRRAYEEDGLSVAEYAGYGPVQHFRNAFLTGYYLLLAEIPKYR
jgi:transaldolase